MHGRDILTALIAAILVALPVISVAQAPRGVPRIAFVQIFPLTIETLQLNGLKKGLRELGYEEGKNIVIDSRSAEGNRERLPIIAAELVAAQYDVIVAATGATALAAKRATSSIPIVMAASADAVPQGIIESLARPGGNVTGLTTLSSELAPKRMEILSELSPRLKKVAVLWCPSVPINQIELERVQVSAKKLRLDIRVIDYDGTPTSWSNASQVLREKKPDALFLLDCTTLPFQSIVAFALEQKIPAMGPHSFWAPLGGLVSYGPDSSDMARRSAAYVDKILKGAKPADLPVEQPTKFNLVLNLKTANNIGLTIPQSMLIRVDEVIQ